MSVSQKIKSLLTLSGKDKKGLLEPLGLSSSQALSNKFNRESFNASDLIKIADYCDAKLLFIAQDNSKIYLTSESTQEK